MSRRKGAAGEREAAANLNEVLGTRFHRGRQYHGGPESPDLAGDLPGLHLEVKRCEPLSLYPVAGRGECLSGSAGGTPFEPGGCDVAAAVADG